MLNLLVCFREFMGIMGLFYTTMGMGMHHMVHIHRQVPQFQLWEMMVSYMGLSTTNILPISSL